VQRLQQLSEAADEELVQLQFEQNKWSERERIQKQASGRLGMSLPDSAFIISIQP
jgi:cell division protein FtsL